MSVTFQNERRLYRFLDGAAIAIAGPAGSSDPGAPDTRQTIPPIDPPELLQLSPDKLSLRLEGLKSSLEANLVDKVQSPGPPTRYLASDAVEWMVSSGVVQSADQAVMLGNMLVNKGCIVAPDLDPTDYQQFYNSSTLQFTFSQSETTPVTAVHLESAEIEAQRASGLERFASPEFEAERAGRAEVTGQETTADLDMEIERLSALLAAEEASCEAERQGLEDDKASLRQIQKETEEVNDMQKQEASEYEARRDELMRTQFLLEARQVKLLSELQSIYPIGSTENGFAINKLEIPRGYQGDDEVISSALGYVTHLVIMLSKYLRIPLRYQLIYNASKSAVRDRVAVANPNGNIFPLYSKSQDMKKFDKACRCVEKNVEQILSARNVRYKEHSHVLENLSNLFEHEICPESMKTLREGFS